MDLEKGLEAIRQLSKELKEKIVPKKERVISVKQSPPWENLSDEDWECFCYEVDCRYQSELRKDRGRVKSYNEVEREVWETWERKL